MKPLLLLLLLVSALPAAADGRYQIIAAAHTEILGSIVQTNAIVLKIDTQTGDTWRLVSVTREGKNIVAWLKIPDGTGKTFGELSAPMGGPDSGRK